MVRCNDRTIRLGTILTHAVTKQSPCTALGKIRQPLTKQRNIRSDAQGELAGAYCIVQVRGTT